MQGCRQTDRQTDTISITDHDWLKNPLFSIALSNPVYKTLAGVRPCKLQQMHFELKRTLFTQERRLATIPTLCDCDTSRLWHSPVRYQRLLVEPQQISAKNYENWLAVDKVIAKISRITFLAHPV